MNLETSLSMMIFTAYKGLDRIIVNRSINNLLI